MTNMKKKKKIFNTKLKVCKRLRIMIKKNLIFMGAFKGWTCNLGKQQSEANVVSSHTPTRLYFISHMNLINSFPL